MAKKKKKTRFVFIDDDIENHEQWLRWAKRKGYDGYAVETAFEADKIPADFYIFDITAVAGSIFQAHNAYSAVCTMIENHPGATMVIVSGVSKGTVEDVIDEVEDRIGVRPIYGGWGAYSDLEKAIKDLV
jgi:hypothetical protein